MRWELRPAAGRPADEQATIRTLGLAVYPPEVSTAWWDRAVEQVPDDKPHAALDENTNSMPR